MGWVRCPCGTQISDVGYPCASKGALVTDVKLDQHESTERTIQVDVVLESRDVWECYDCGRIAIDYPEAGSNSIKWYAPIDGAKGDVMKPQPWEREILNESSPSPTPATPTGLQP